MSWSQSRSIRYAVNHWGGLEQFLNDGHRYQDRRVRDQTCNPAFFAGTAEGGETWATLASLVWRCNWSGLMPPPAAACAE
jgi:transposase